VVGLAAGVCVTGLIARRFYCYYYSKPVVSQHVEQSVELALEDDGESGFLEKPVQRKRYRIRMVNIVRQRLVLSFPALLEDTPANRMCVGTEVSRILGTYVREKSLRLKDAASLHPLCVAHYFVPQESDIEARHWTHTKAARSQRKRMEEPLWEPRYWFGIPFMVKVSRGGGSK
jgi:hypothetical protein